MFIINSQMLVLPAQVGQHLDKVKGGVVLVEEISEGIKKDLEKSSMEKKTDIKIRTRCLSFCAMQLKVLWTKRKKMPVYDAKHHAYLGSISNVASDSGDREFLYSFHLERLMDLRLQGFRQEQRCSLTKPDSSFLISNSPKAKLIFRIDLRKK